MTRLDRTHTLNKNVHIEVDGIDATYDVIKVRAADGADYYGVDLVLGRGGFFGSVQVGQFRFDRPAGGTIAAYAHAFAERIVRSKITEAEQPAVFVVIDDFPGFADDMLGEHVQAGYRGTGGKPRYVVRAKDAIEADEVIERVEAIGTIVDGGRQFSPKVINVTDHAHEAVDGSTSFASDPLTYITVKRVEDVIDGGIGA